VCAPQGEPIAEATHFHRKLAEAELPFGGVIVNRVRVDPAGSDSVDDIEPALVEALGDAELAARVAANHRDFRALAVRDRTNMEGLVAELGLSDVIEVPYLDDDVHDLAGLMEVNRYLFAATEQRAVSTAEPLP